MPCNSNGTNVESSPVTCWSRRINAFNETPKTLPSSFRFLLNGLRLSKATLWRSKMVANSSHSNGCNFFNSVSFNWSISHPPSLYSGSHQSVWSMPLSRHKFSKLTGSEWFRILLTGSGLECIWWWHGVDVALLLNKLWRNGEFDGLCSGVDGCDDDDVLSGELLLYKLLWLRAFDICVERRLFKNKNKMGITSIIVWSTNNRSYLGHTNKKLKEKNLTQANMTGLSQIEFVANELCQVVESPVIQCRQLCKMEYHIEYVIHGIGQHSHVMVHLVFGVNFVWFEHL